LGERLAIHPRAEGVKIKVYIQTYDDADALHGNLESLYANMGPKPDDVNVEVHIINNHPNFRLDPKFDKVVVYHDAVRPSWSTGHPARTWNAALMLGFKDLHKPDCDLVVCIQDDMIWEYDWLYWLLEVHKTYNFYTCSWGDAFCSYTAEAVKRIGIWDERFCTLGIQEADYLLRALIYNKEGSSINDIGVGRILNPWTKPIDDDDHGKVWVPGEYHLFTKEYLKGNIANRNHFDPTPRQEAGSTYHRVSVAVWYDKWGGHVMPEFWTQEFIDNPTPRPKCPTYVMYPYFEKEIYDKQEKGYLAER
jgi:hypothetical protein